MCPTDTTSGAVSFCSGTRLAALDQQALTSGPSIRPFQLVRSESSDGKAEMPAGHAIMSDMSSELSLHREETRKLSKRQDASGLNDARSLKPAQTSHERT